MKAEADPVEWRPVRSPVFLYAAAFEDHWWVLRLNDFPEHPLFTLFVDGSFARDVDDPQLDWDLDAAKSRSPLTEEERIGVLELMRGLGPYGSEIDSPCESDWCTCSVLTDEYVARLE